MVGFDRVNRDQSQLDKLRTVSLQGRHVNDTLVDIGSRLPALRELDLSVRKNVSLIINTGNRLLKQSRKGTVSVEYFLTFCQPFNKEVHT